MNKVTAATLVSIAGIVGVTVIGSLLVLTKNKQQVTSIQQPVGPNTQANQISEKDTPAPDADKRPLLMTQYNKGQRLQTIDYLCEYIATGTCNLYAKKGTTAVPLKSLQEGTLETTDSPNKKLVRWKINYSDISQYDVVYANTLELPLDLSNSSNTPIPTNN